MENFEFLNELQGYGVVVMIVITMILRWIASFAAVLLMALDQTKWKCSTNILTSLLAPYLFCSLPQVILQFLRTESGKWIACITVVLNVFLPNHLHEWLKIPGATILLIVVTPNDFMKALKDKTIYVYVCLVALLMIAYLLRQHTKACGGNKNSFTQKDKITYTICLWLMFLYAVFSTFVFSRFSRYFDW